MLRYSTMAVLVFAALLTPSVIIARQGSSPMLMPMYMAVLSVASIFMLPALLGALSLLLLLLGVSHPIPFMMGLAIFILQFADRLAFHHPITARAMAGCASLEIYALRLNGRLSEGTQAARRTLLYLEESQGKSWPHLAPVLSDLGALYLEMGRIVKAKTALTRALSLAEAGHRQAGTDASLSGVARTLRNLAAVHVRLGDFPLAIAQFRRCLELNEKGVTQSPADLALLLCNMANACMQNSDYKSALPLLQRAYVCTTDAQAPCELEVSIEDHLGETFRGLGNLTEAKRHLSRAFKLASERLSKKDPHTARVLEDLGKLYRDLGDFETAEAYFRQNVDLVRQVGRGESLEFSRCLKSYADCLRRMNRGREADDLERRAEKIRYKVRSA